MYKQRIMPLVLAAGIGMSSGFNLHAGDKWPKGSSFAAYMIGFNCLVGGIATMVFGYQLWKHDFIAKEVKWMEINTENSELVRDGNKIWISQLGSSYSDEDAKRLNFSDSTRLVLAVNRDKKNKDTKYSDFESVKKEIYEKNRPLTWKEWWHGHKN